MATCTWCGDDYKVDSVWCQDHKCKEPKEKKCHSCKMVADYIRIESGYAYCFQCIHDGKVL